MRRVMLRSSLGVLEVWVCGCGARFPGRQYLERHQRDWGCTGQDLRPITVFRNT